MEAMDFGKMIRAITANTNNYIGGMIEKFGIRQGQFEYFLLIYGSPGINQNELARLKSVGKASVTKALKILEDDGFIRRVSDDVDKRNTRCYITGKGELITDDLLKIRAAAAEVLFDGFSEADKAALYQQLFRLHQNSAQLGANPK